MNFNTAYVGISPFSDYYSTKSLTLYIKYLAIHHKEIAFLIGDWVYKYTFQGRGYSEHKSIDIVNKKGDDYVAMLIKLCSNICKPIKFKIFKWQDLQIEEYYFLLNSFTEYYNSNDIFASSVRKQVFLNLGEEIVKTNYDLSLFDRYILHELAGLIVISEYLGYEVEYYPGVDLVVLENIYNGKYQELLTILPKIHKRKFISLKFTIS